MKELSTRHTELLTMHKLYEIHQGEGAIHTMTTEACHTLELHHKTTQNITVTHYVRAKGQRLYLLSTEASYHLISHNITFDAPIQNVPY